MDWNQAISSYKDYLTIERGLSENSVVSYVFDIKRITDFLLENDMERSPLTINADDLRVVLYQGNRKYETSSQSRLISSLKGFFSYLVFEKQRQDNPMDLIEAPKIKRTLPDILSLDEVDGLIACIDKNSKQASRNHAIVELLYSCGLRVSELIALQLSNLFFEDGYIVVIGKGNKQRFIPICDHAQQLILDYINSDRKKLDIKQEYQDIVFLNRRGKQLTRAMIFTIVKRLGDLSGCTKKVSPHSLRHSFATHLLENGANLHAIQLMLGHEHITTTEIYLHLNKEHLRKTLYECHPRS